MRGYRLGVTETGLSITSLEQSVPARCNGKKSVRCKLVTESVSERGGPGQFLHSVDLCIIVELPGNYKSC